MASSISRVADILMFALLPLSCLPPARGSSGNAMQGRHELDLCGPDWQVACASCVPSSGMMAPVPASVPGDLNDALAKAGHISVKGSLYFGRHLEQSYPLAYEHWWLNKSVHVPANWSSLTVRHLLLEGLDYNGTVFLNGHSLGTHVGQYRRAKFDVAGLLVPGASNEVAVLFHPPPNAFLDQWLAPGNGAQGIMNDYLDWWKSMVGLGYDFGQPIWSMGLWRPARLLGFADSRILSDLQVVTVLRAPYVSAQLNLSVAIEMAGGNEVSTHVRWHVECITFPSASPASAAQIITLKPGANNVSISLTLESPALWWPRGIGQQHMYQARVQIIDADRVADDISVRFGVRELREAENAGPPSWRYIEEFACGPKEDPNNCTFPPADATPAEVLANRSWTFEINGRRVFAHGSNWVPCDMMIGRCGVTDYDYLLRMAAEANINYLRVWGGGGIETDEFYDAADKYGILIYQEMVHSQAMPSRDANLIAEAVEVKEAIKRIHNHPSLVRYGWGNEFYGVNRTSNIFERQYEDIAGQLDAGRKATHGSPVTWAARHGPYCFYFSNIGGGGDFPCLYSPGYAAYNMGTMNQEGPNDPFEWDEYGAAGMASEYSLRRMIPAEHTFPVNSSQEDWIFHRAFNAVGAGPEWLSREGYVAMFGQPPDLKHEIYASQFAQSEGLRYSNQAHRRAMPHRSMSAFWTFNEAWPNAAYGSIVEFFGPLKMAYYLGTKKPYAMTDVSLRYDQIAFPAGTSLAASVWYVTEATSSFPAHIRASLVATDGKILGQQEWEVDVIASDKGPGTSQQVGTLDIELPRALVGSVALLRLQLAQDGGASLDSSRVVSEEVYAFGVLPPGTPGGNWSGLSPPLAGLWKAPLVKVDVHLTRGADDKSFDVMLSNPGAAPGLYLELKVCSSDSEQFHPVVFSDNFLVLWGGEQTSIHVELLSIVSDRHGFTGKAPESLCIQGWNVAPACERLAVADAEYI